MFGLIQQVTIIHTVKYKVVYNITVHGDMFYDDR